MKCPHCQTAIHAGWKHNQFFQMPPHGAVDPGSVWSVQYMICPECENFIAELRLTDVATSQLVKGAMVWPLHHVRPVAPEVDSAYADDYSEAAAILGISPKASAALSRRLVQHVIREKAGIKKGSLDEEITMLIGAGVLPGWLASNVDAIRAVGNFAAHPIKSTNTGEVVEVEPGEAEFLLDVLDDLFDFYFVQPEKAKQHLAGINAKLADAGKPALKQVPPAGTTSP